MRKLESAVVYARPSYHCSSLWPTKTNTGINVGPALYTPSEPQTNIVTEPEVHLLVPTQIMNSCKIMLAGLNVVVVSGIGTDL